MDWQFFTSISVIASSTLVIIQRVILRNQKTDPIAFVLLTQLINSIVMTIIAILNGWKMPDLSLYWFPMLVTFVLYGGGHILYAHTLKRVEASVFSILLATSTVWVMAMGVIVFDEIIGLREIIGALLIFASIVLLTERTGKIKLDRSIVMGLVMGLIFGIASAAWVYVGKLADSLTWIALSAIGPGLVVLFIQPRAVLKIKPLLTKSVLAKMALLSASFGVANLAMLIAYKSGPITSVAPLLQTNILVTVLLGIVFLGERARLLHKIGAGIVCLLGVLLLI